MEEETFVTASSRVPQWLRIGVGIAISVACLAFVLSRVDLGGVLRALETFKWPFLLAALATLAVGYCARIIRWWVMLRAAGASASALQCAPAFLGSIALNNVLPLRLGDIVRALVFPASLGVSRTTATGSLVLERLIDLATLLVWLVLGIAFGSKVELPSWVQQGAIGLAILGFGGLFFVLVLARPLAFYLRRFAEGRQGGALPRITQFAADLLDSMGAMSRPLVIVQLLVLSLIVWGGETGVFYFVLAGFGGPVDLSGAAIVMAIATIATLVPSSPGYVGPFHAAAFAAASMLGGDPESAASFALLVHLALWLPTTLAGGIAILLNPAMFTGLRSRTDQPNAN